MVFWCLKNQVALITEKDKHYMVHLLKFSPSMRMCYHGKAYLDWLPLKFVSCFCFVFFHFFVSFEFFVCFGFVFSFSWKKALPVGHILKVIFSQDKCNYILYYFCVSYCSWPMEAKARWKAYHWREEELCSSLAIQDLHSFILPGLGSPR